MANFGGTLTGVNFFDGWSWSGWSGANWGSTNQKEIYSYGYPPNLEQHYPVYRVEFDPQGYECTSITFEFHATMTRSDGRTGSVLFSWYETDPTSGSGTVIATTSRVYPAGASSVTDELTVNFISGKTFSSRKTLYLKVSVPGSGTSSNPGTVNGTVYINSASVHSDFEPSALTPIIQAPKGGTYQGNRSIEFRWTSQGDGSQTQAEIEVNDQSGNYYRWATLDTETDWSLNANTLEPGTRQWRIRLTSSFGVVSDWVYASFTVSYPDVNITPTAPIGGTAYGGEDIRFSWEFSGDGSVWQVQMQLSYDNGASWEDVSLRSYDYYTAPALSLPEGRILWRIRSIADWHDWTAWKQSSFSVTYNAVSTVFVTQGPTSGAYNAQTPIFFAAELRASGPVRDPFTVASATLYWKNVNDAEFTAEEMTPNAEKATVTVAGGTFPQGPVVWYISATDNTGHSSETDHYSFTAVMSEVDATPTAPINTIQNGRQQIGFSWSYASLDGSVQSRAELQYSTDKETWTTFANVTGADGYTIVSPNTFPGATIYWRVRAYNGSGTVGMWSNPVSFTCYAPPKVSSVACDGKPFATITWNAAGQETFELEAGGRTYGPYNDKSARSFVLPEPLEDGEKVIRVKTQNKYNLWSQWDSITITINNQEESQIDLYADTGSSDGNVLLHWNNGDTPAANLREYLVYRNGVLIRRTTQTELLDRVALGVNDYTVIARLVSGYYNKSDIAEAETAVSCPMIAPLAGGAFLELRLSENDDREIQVTEAQEVVFTQYAGAEYPSAEIGEARSKSVSLDVSALMSDSDFAEAFKALLGNDVIVKTPGGEVVVGPLPGYNRRDRSSHRAWTFTITQEDWRDFVDES